PLLAAGTVPYQPLRAVSAIRAAVAGARRGELAKALDYPVQRRGPAFGLGLGQLVGVDQVRQDLVAEHEALNAVCKSRRLYEITDDRRIRQFLLDRRILGRQLRYVSVEAF